MVVEDDLLVAGTLEIALESRNYRVLGPVETVDVALNLRETQSPDVPLIDCRLANSTSEKLLDPLCERHIPARVLTGLSADEMPVSTPVAVCCKTVPAEYLARRVGSCQITMNPVVVSPLYGRLQSARAMRASC